MGVKLFTRDPLKVTTIGQEIYEAVKSGFSDLDFALILAKSRENLEYGKMSIGCPSHITQFFLMERIAKAVNDYPNLQIELDTESKISELIQLLKDNKIDFAILDSIPNEVKKDVEIKEIKEIEYIFVSKNEIKIKDAKELEIYNYILPYENKTSNVKLIEILKNNEISINTVLRCPTTEPRIEAAKLNIGIAYVMKDAVKNELESKELYEVQLPFKLVKNKLNIVYLKNHLTKVDKQFINNYILK